MATEVKAITSNQLTPDLFERLKANRLYTNWSYVDWLKKMNWSLINNPFRAEAPIAYGLYDQEKLLAFVSFTYMPLIIKGQSEIVASYGDFCAFPGCPIQETLRFVSAYMKDKPTPSIVGFHASEATSVIWKKFGASVIHGGEKTFVKLISQKNRFIHHLKLVFRKKITVPNFQTKILKIKNRDCHLLDCSSVSDFEQDVERLFEIQNIGVEVATLRSAAYLVWRYLSSPFSSSYYFVKVFAREKLVGFFVGQKKQTDFRICEFVYDADDEASREALLSALTYLAKKLGCISIVTKIVSPDDEKFWEKRKFTVIRKPYNQFLFVRENRDSKTSILFGLFTYGDFKLV